MTDDRTLDTLLVSPAAPDPAQQRPLDPPIVTSTTYIIDDDLEVAMAAGDYRSRYLYSRMGNPTVRALERRLAELHGANDAVCTASGMGAMSVWAFGLTAPATRVVADARLYGATSTLLTHYVAPAGRDVRFVDLSDTTALGEALDGAPTGSWVLGETITNPRCDLLDIEATARVAHAAGARLAVDNTFAGPVLCRPLEHGADLVLESLSKSIAGHSDVHGGAVVGGADDVQAAWHAMVHLGPSLDAGAAARIWRGAKTMALRVRAACANAAALADALAAHPAVARVRYPGRDAAELATRQCGVGGAMLALELRGGDHAARAVLHALRVAHAASSLGGVETLVSMPSNTSHRTAEARARVGLAPGTLRVSVGCETAADLIADFEAALGAIGG